MNAGPSTRALRTVSVGSLPRVASLAQVDPRAAALVATLLERAPDAIAAAYLPERGEMAQTVRAVPGPHGVVVRAEGRSPRYTAMAALGLARLPLEVQQRVLSGGSSLDLAHRLIERTTDDDPGALALAAWVAAEVVGEADPDLLRRCRAVLDSGAPVSTVALSWIVVAAVASHHLLDSADLVERGTRRLLGVEGPRALFPHLAPPRVQSPWRRHVGSFADSIYPVQALARAAGLTGDRTLLAAAERSAHRLCLLQGAAGQWWWHYDVRDASVVERYPVYSVHQHAMAPMVLLDVAEAGGADRRREIAAGLRWLEDHPEVVEEMVHEGHRLVWRKVGRREPRKAARGLGALTTSVHRGWTAPGIDRWLRPSVVDHECRPYEPAWLLHAWLPARDTAGSLVSEDPR